MLPSLGFKGTTEVINKGTDVTLIADKEGAEELFQISRYLVVCGISAAVLAVTELDPVDMKTIGYYEDTTLLLLFFDRTVADAVIPLLSEETEYQIMETADRQQLLKELPGRLKEIKEKRKQEK